MVLVSYTFGNIHNPMLTKLQFQPGINRDTTSYTNTGGWFDSDMVRFRNGLPEKIGGWARVYTSQTALTGVCRKMYAWSALNGTEYTAMPTNERFYVENGTTISDITPVRRTLTLAASPFATTNASTTIVVTDVGHGAVAGDIVFFSGATSVAGVSIAVLNNTSGYSIGTILTTDTYSVDFGAVASSTTTGGGSAVVANYLFKRGSVTTTSFSGWGSGAWGGSTTPTTAFTLTNTIATSTASNTTIGGIAKTLLTITTPSAHGRTTGDWFLLNGAVAVGGVPAYYLSQAMQITSTPTTTTLTAYCIGTATSSVSGGGSGVNLSIWSAAANYGWSFGPTSLVTTYYSGLWSVDNYGEDMVACPRDSIDSYALVSNPVATTNLSTTVVVTQASHGFTTGMSIILGGVEATGGITALDLNGAHTITVLTSSTYSFVAASAANATLNGGGAVAYAYTSTLIYWDVQTGRALSLSRMSSVYTKKFLPYTATEVLVSDVDRHVIAFGTNPFDTTQPVDKMTIRYSDSRDPTNWDASSTLTTAGELRCSAGSYIVTALQNREEILVWTDVALYTMGPSGTYTYGLQLVGTGFDIIGANAKTAVGAAAFWMGLNNFYTYNGAVAPLPCTVRDYVFNDINRDAGYKVYCSVDSGNNEIIWFYPSASSTENNRYVTFNYLDNIWYYGSLARTAWMDRGQYVYPRAIDANGYLYNHEYGYDDGSTTPATAITAYAQSSPIEIEGGDSYLYVSRIIPDVNFRNSSLSLGTNAVVKFTLKTQDFPGGETFAGNTRSVTRGSTASVTVDRFTNQVYTRLRARSVDLRIQSDTIGVAWRLGTPRIEIRKDGRK